MFCSVHSSRRSDGGPKLLTEFTPCIVQHLASTNPVDILNAARCFEQCVPSGYQNPLRTYLLSQVSTCSDPLAPANLTIILVTDTSISITWTQPLDIPPVATNLYVIKWGTASGVYTFSASVSGSTFGYSMTGLMPSTTYFFVVEGFSGLCSATSAESSQTTSAPGNGLLSGLLGYWKLDEVSNVNRADATGNGFTATQTGGNTPAAAGIINNGADFNAVVTKGLSVAANIDTRAQATPFSIQFWYFPTNFLAGNAYAATLNSGGTKGFLFYTANNGALHFYSTDDAGTISDKVMSTTLLGLNAWSHVVCVFDGTLVNAYVNGVINGVGQALAGLGISKGQQVFMIGNYSNAAAGVQGVCDEVAYWDRALSATDVANLYNAGAALPFSSFT